MRAKNKAPALDRLPWDRAGVTLRLQARFPEWARETVEWGVRVVFAVEVHGLTPQEAFAQIAR
jgi:hypothetical protein